MYCKLFYWIAILLNGEKVEHSIEASASKDTYETFKLHVISYVPWAKFLGFQMGEMFEEEEDEDA